MDVRQNVTLIAAEVFRFRSLVFRLNFLQLYFLTIFVLLFGSNINYIFPNLFDFENNTSNLTPSLQTANLT